ncbi:MAG: extracellular solute-binding protein, partial [Chloroflexi bacterium]|nr:extracellular solute-binding protein [Chloroflexota bacterium]
MQRKTLWIITMLVAALMLAACGGSDTPAPAEEPAPVAEEPAAEPTEAPAAEPVEPAEEVTLTMGSWRVDDVEQMNTILDAFHANYPNITINFDPTNPPEYNAVLRTQLEGGTAPDLFYLRSFSTSRQLFEEGFLEPLDDVDAIGEAFTPAGIAPWATDDGMPYGVPFIAVSHGIYYNQAIFDELGLSEPTSWGELLQTAQALQDAGYDAFANASGDEWTIAEIVFMNLAPNFIGGREGRLAYLNGERCFNDENAVAAFQAVADLAPYLPDGQEALTYYDSQQLFLLGEAGMWMGGSWDIPFFESEATDFDWSVFAMPAPEGNDEHVTFHLDAGMGLNAASENKEAAKLFLEWMASDELAQLLANELPGFFPIHANAPAVDNDHANTFLSLNAGRGLDVRWAWPVLLDGSPDGYALMQSGAVDIVNGNATSQEAADALQEGLAQWLEAAQNCSEGAVAEAPADTMDEEVTLIMGSWRVDDVEQMETILDAFQAEHPNITINFDPTNPPEYNAVLRTQLEGGTAPDLFYLRSFSTSRQLFEEGFLEPLDDIGVLKDSFTAAGIAPWATDEGMPYGVPFIAVSHGIYYNQDIFDELGLSEPTSWAELLTTAQALQDAGYDAFANASGDEWTIAEIVFMNLAPNFIGGREGRLAYLDGERCFNDENAVAAFQAVADLAPYLPDGQEALTYYDSQQLFLLGEAGMWMGGSWDIPFFESEATDFDWSIFAMPAPEGNDEHVTFHLDAGMGMNAAS